MFAICFSICAKQRKACSCQALLIVRKLVAACVSLTHGLLQLLPDFLQRKVGVALCLAASVEHEDLHISLPPVFLGIRI